MRSNSKLDDTNFQTVISEMDASLGFGHLPTQINRMIPVKGPTYEDKAIEELVVGPKPKKVNSNS